MAIPQPEAFVASQPVRIERLRRWEVTGLVLFAAITVLFGVWVEIHSAFLRIRYTDLADFLRAGWAVRTGHDLYRVTEDHGWHYNFPPFFAILMTPLADPPRGAAHAWMVPFGFSVALWYLFSLVCVALASDTIARSLETAAVANHLRTSSPSARQWWRMRLIPILVCIAPIGFTLSRGQVNLLLLWMLAAMIGAVTTRRPWRAGLFLAVAACIKIFPLYLLVYPLWRRDLRFLAGAGAGLLFGLILLPISVFGVHRTVAYYGELSHTVLAPATIGGTDRSRARELIDPNATDSQSFQTIIHNTLHWREQLTVPRRQRSTYFSPIVRLAHWAVVAILTLITLWRAGPERTPLKEIVVLSSLIIVMLLASPVCHLHYFAMATPLAAVLLLYGENDRFGYWGGRFGWLLAAFFVLNALPLIPGFEILRDLGAGMYAALALWWAGVTVLPARRPNADTPAFAEALSR